MSRAMHFTSDQLIAAGHSVDHLFQEDIGSSLGGPRMRRFVVPLRIPRMVHRASSISAPYDVVEVHEPLAAFYCWRRQFDASLPPIIVFSHGLEERGMAAGIAYRRAKGLRVSLKHKISPYSVVAQAMYAVRKADQVSCCSKEDIDYLAARGVPRKHLAHYQNGVSAAFIDLAPEDSTSADLLYVGSWLERKGILDLIAAVAEVLRRYPNLRFTAAGFGIATNDHVLSDFPLDVRRRVRTVPIINGEDELVQLYLNHGVFILPSIFEGHPLVMLEAAACGLTIVTTDTCGMHDFIRDDYNGLLISVGDVAGLTAALERAVADERLRRRIGSAARESAKSHTWKMSAERLDYAYTSAVYNRRGGPNLRGNDDISG